MHRKMALRNLRPWMARQVLLLVIRGAPAVLVAPAAEAPADPVAATAA